MSRSVIEYLNHISAELDFLKKASENLTLDNFLKDEILKRAFARSLEIIGEAAKAVPDEVRYNNPHIEWKAMAGMRDKLIHHYFGVDYELVWNIIENEIVELSFQINNVLKELK
ncbi:DUF86 domain-containing protein [Carboxylicivirga sp. M1479]|uniref:HepT-like ribonuclease domain-containing protein n=1 Tax=Carboxylicivirga sp. M1479 TaxID=2594476 RepID=UPI00117847E0|nr:DUF86 domain-containing protein [Carboxylicivirga sp. M1479]TRX59835.1 DUF86 domain-containing protein [Carboxylicivirga sp. M1479]